MSLNARLARLTRIARAAIQAVVSIYPARTWCWLVAPLTIAMVLIAGVGPQLQAHTLPLSTSIAPTIYDSIYPDELARFPSISGWILSSFGLSSIFVAVSVAVSAARADSAHRFALYAGAVFAISYTIVDIALILFWKVPFHSFAGSVVANVSGGVFIVFICYFILSVISYLYEKIPFQQAQIASAFAISFVGLSSSVAVYIAIVGFYRPLEANIDLTVGLPLEGDIGPRGKSRLRGEGGDDGRALRIVPSKSTVTLLEATSPDQAGVATWRRATASPSYRVDLRIHSDCPTYETLGARPLPAASFRNVNEFRLNNGASNIAIYGDRPFTIDAKINSTVYMWHPKSNADGLLNLKLFTGKSDRFELESYKNVGINSVSYLLSKKVDRLQAKTISFVIDGKSYKVTIVPPRSAKRDAKLSCNYVRVESDQVQELIRSGNLSVNVDGAIGGIQFDFVEQPDQSDSILIDQVKLSFEDLNGWVDIEGIDSGPRDYLGNFGSATFSGDVSKLSAYGRSIDSGHESMFLVGDFSLHKTSGDSLRISGIASAAVKSGERLNQTRWELMSEGMKLFLLTSLATAVAAVFAFSRKTLKGKLNEDPKTWVL